MTANGHQQAEIQQPIEIPTPLNLMNYNYINPKDPCMVYLPINLPYKSPKCIITIPSMEHISSIISPKKTHGPTAPSSKKRNSLASHSETKLKLRTCGLKTFRTSHRFSLTLFGWTLGSFLMMNWVNPTYGDFVYFPIKQIEQKRKQPRLKMNTKTFINMFRMKFHP